jgi:Cu/Ag efflux protein CusF
LPNHSAARRIAVLLTVAAVALGGLALPAAAKGGQKARGKQQTVQTAAHTTKAQERREAVKARKAAAKARKEAAKARKAARFVATGVVTAVDASSVEVQLTGGTLKALRRAGTPVTFTVAENATIRRDGETVALDALQLGDHVMLKGAKDGENFVARKVRASAPEVENDVEGTDDAAGDESGDDGSGDDDSGDDDSGADDDSGTATE